MLYLLGRLALREDSVDGVAISDGEQCPTSAGRVDCCEWGLDAAYPVLPGKDSLAFEKDEGYGLREHAAHDDRTTLDPACADVGVPDDLLLHHGQDLGLLLHSRQELVKVYTKRWFMNHCPVQVIRVMLSGIQLRAPILHT